MLVLSYAAFLRLGLHLSDLLPSNNYCLEVRPTKINKHFTTSYGFIYSLSWISSFTTQNNEFHRISILMSSVSHKCILRETNTWKIWFWAFNIEDIKWVGQQCLLVNYELIMSG